MDGDQIKNAEVYDSTIAYAAGAMYSTVGDLYKFHIAMLQNKIIKDYHKLEAYTPVMDTYGLGWFTSQIGEYKVIGHNGGAAGFRSDLSSIESEGICVILLNNMETDLNSLSNKLLQAALDLPVKISKEITATENELKAYVGLYQMDKDNHFYFTVIDGHLMVKPPNSLLQQATYLGSDNFYEELGDVEFSFIRNEAGKVVSFRFVKKDGSVVIPVKINESWGIVGSATINGWDGPDAKLVSMPDKTWVLSNVKLSDGEIKFRLNDTWSVNLGKGPKSSLLEYGGENLAVEKGIYDIKLSIDGAKYPTIEMTKKD